MSQTLNVHEAKTHLSRLLERVEHGEEIIIARAGKPVARLVPIEPSDLPKRTFGTMAGQIWFAPDYDEADAEIEAMFEESINRPFPGFEDQPEESR